MLKWKGYSEGDRTKILKIGFAIFFFLKGIVVLSFAVPLHNGSILDVELYVLWRCLLALKELGAIGSILEDNSKIVVSWVVGSLCALGAILIKLIGFVIACCLLGIQCLGPLAQSIQRLMSWLVKVFRFFWRL